MKILLFFHEYGYEEYPLDHELKRDQFCFYLNDNEVFFMDEGKDPTKMIPQFKYHINDTEFMLISDVCKFFEKNEQPLFIGNKNSDIEIKHEEIILEKEKMIVNTDISNSIYINGIRHKDAIITYALGDRILLKEVLFIVHESYIKIFGDVKTYHSNLPDYRIHRNEMEKFPEYKRSPRIIKRLKQDKISISRPPEKVNRKKNSLVKVIVPPLVMAAGTVAMSLMMGRGLYMLIGLAGTTVSLVFSITAYFSDTKEIKQKQYLRVKTYESYLAGIRKKLNTYKNNEVEALHYNNPNIKEINDMIQGYNPRIYERDINDDDFLQIEVGRSTDTSEYTITLDNDDLSTDTDTLLDEAREIYNEYRIIENKPFNIDLKKAHLGIVGEVHEIHEQLKWIMSQLTFFHSYHDIQIVALYNEKFIDEFDYIKWYPHVKLHAINMTGNIYNERIRDHVLGSLHQILKERKLKRDESKKEMSFLPHFVIVIDEPHMIVNHSIMEYLQENSTDLGFSLIYTAQKRANLPENIKTVLVMEDIDTATLLLNEGVEVNKRLHEERIGDVDLEAMARKLSVLEHMQGVSSHIPESVTFLEMYKVDTPEELQIKERWKKGESHKSLAVPIGLRGEDDLEELNLHEKAHGPHGLVAGTTGSGKSETIQTYILSLAVNFSPYEVGFLLIDYKGGGMANLFKDLPHLLGTITNLDGAESMRALASIKAELARRQRIFNENNVNNINNYNQLFRSEKAAEPLPHLFIISDEFAELKKEQPDFMTELVSVARIGRTLGVHLILATQKPTGVVDDQIWSNSKFKLALKVQDESDSKEIIKTPDAAFITQTGRGYLQVGNNEIYELFQSAWSGATYSNDKEMEKIDERIYKINLLGQGELINKDLSSSSKEGNMTTQLDAVVAHISSLYTHMEHKEVMRPWLPALGNLIVSPYIRAFSDTSLIEKIDIRISLGQIDIPEEQKQEEYELDFIKEGNLAIFSSSGYGKSTTLGTIILSLAVKNNPMLLNMYIIDLGNSSLIPYRGLPHVADYMNFDSNEKLNKFSLIINSIIKERKQIFAQEMVQNYDMYNQLHEERPMKAIFIIIDNFDVVKELSMDFDDFLLRTTRDGAGLGIYTVISATRSNAVRFAMLNNFKNKIAQYMFDESDISSIVGRSKYRISDDVKGRALIKRKNVNMMQIYAPVPFENDVDLITELKSSIQQIADKYTGDKVMGIPILPDVFTTQDFDRFNCEKSKEDLIGLSLNKVENVSLDISDSPFLVLGPSKSGKTNFLKILLDQRKGMNYIFDSDSRDLYRFKGMHKITYITEENVKVFVEDLFSEIEMRKANLKEALDSGKVSSPKEFYDSLSRVVMFIDDVDTFVQKMQEITGFAELLNQAVNVGIKIIATANTARLKGFDDVTKFFKNATSGAVLGQMGSLSIFSLSMRDIPNFGYAVLCYNGDMKKVKLPKYYGIQETIS